MADSDKLKNYTPRKYPTITGGDALYLIDQLSNISQSIVLLNQVVKKLEARLVAGGL